MTILYVLIHKLDLRFMKDLDLKFNNHCCGQRCLKSISLHCTAYLVVSNIYLLQYEIGSPIDAREIWYDWCFMIFEWFAGEKGLKK